MASLTLSFKGQKLKIFALESTDTVIGRDDSCAIFIDSLAIEPQHAIIRQHGDICTVEPVDQESHVLVNAVRVEKAHKLSDRDNIQIGKHTLTYSIEQKFPAQEAPQPLQTRTYYDAHHWLQIQSGSHLGRTIRLDKAFTRIGSTDSNLAIIARRYNGYYLSHLDGEQHPVVNDRTIGDTAHRLCHGDNISVGELQVQFFSGMTQAPQENTDMSKSDEHTEQRKFRRIPFDVSVSLHLGDTHWESTLADISLHGALIHTPENFTSNADAQYRLDIHLEGGPDIAMDVHVAHQEPGTTGLRCDDIDVDSITHLRRLVELNLGDPELLERELSALAPVETN